MSVGESFIILLHKLFAHRSVNVLYSVALV